MRRQEAKGEADWMPDAIVLCFILNPISMIHESTELTFISNTMIIALEIKENSEL